MSGENEPMGTKHGEDNLTSSPSAMPATPHKSLREELLEAELRKMSEEMNEMRKMFQQQQPSAAGSSRQPPAPVHHAAVHQEDAPTNVVPLQQLATPPAILPPQIGKYYDLGALNTFPYSHTYTLPTVIPEFGMPMQPLHTVSQSQGATARPPIESHATVAPPSSSSSHTNTPPPLQSSHRGPVFGNQSHSISQYQFFPRQLIDLPPFDGSADQWAAFIVSFTQTTQYYGYTNMENHTRLQKCLGGRAKQVAGALLIHPNSVPQVIETLEFHFGRPDLLINHHIAKIRAHPNISPNKPADLINFQSELANMIIHIKATAAQSRLHDHTLLSELVAKLPPGKRTEWVKFNYYQYQGNGDLEMLSSWLRNEAKFLMLSEVAGSNPLSAQQSSSSSRNATAKSVNAIATAPDAVPVAIPEPVERKVQEQCCCLNQSHSLPECPEFKCKSAADRWEFVKSIRCCFSCLKFGHTIPKCRNRKPCGEGGCKKRHHKLLHDDTEPPPPSSSPTAAAQVIAPIVRSSNHIDQCNDSLYKYLPITVVGPKGRKTILAFIDDGSKVTLITKSLVRELGLNGQCTNITLKWGVDGKTSCEPSERIGVKIHNCADQSTILMRNVFTIDNLSLPEQCLDVDAMTRAFPEINGIPLIPYDKRQPEVLIGISHTNLIRPLQSMAIGEHFGVQKTLLGWVFYGGKEPNDAHVGHIDIIDEYEDQLAALHRTATNYFEKDQLPESEVIPLFSAEDKRALKLLEVTTSFADNHYETGLLWNADEIKLPSSYGLALSRLKTMEKKMAQDADLAKWYRAKIEDYVAKGYASKLLPSRIKEPIGPVWYLPHFVVQNPNKGNKRRLVFDAAAKIGGISLNSHLLKGPSTLQPTCLTAVLLHFREGPIGVCADIREMFHRISIRDADQDAQRFLWRTNENDPVHVYAMKAMIFGSRSSPCSAQYIKNTNAAKYEQEFPRAAKAIRDYHYVDDYVDSFDNEAEAVAIAEQVTRIHSKAGFELRSFVSNSIALLKDLESRDVAIDLEGDDKKILGMYWDPAADEFRFRLDFGSVQELIRQGKQIPTKCQLLSMIMSVFDPFGLLANIMVKTKLIMRDVWESKVGWKDFIPDNIFEDWKLWLLEIQRATSFRIPRWHCIAFKSAAVQLHVFTDASQDAYTAVAYWRSSIDGCITVSFIMGKCRSVAVVAPTIPRLELQGALLGSKLLTTILNSHSVKPDQVFLWTDSMTVINWLKNDPGRQTDKFITTRLFEILCRCDASKWNWVPGPANPADVATRKDIKSDSLWINGPAFLTNDPSAWPKIPESGGAEPPLTSETLVCVVTREQEVDSIIDYERYSSLHRLKKVVVYVLRAVERFKLKRNLRVGAKLRSARKNTHCQPIAAQEYNAAELLICRRVQQGVFSEAFESNRPLKKRMKKCGLEGLHPLISQDGLLRVNGRLQNAPWATEDMRHPIIIPKSHPVTTLVIRQAHEKLRHANQSAVIATIRTKYWIPSLRRQVQKFSRECQFCRNRAVKPVQPIMGQLPEDRLQPYVRPFSYVGVDYAGPFFVAIGRRREKRWIALFTCLTVRAIHLEVAHDLSSDAMIICLRNFMNRRGTPVRIRSDQGTNFVGALKEGTGLFAAECANSGIEWLFNVPSNPAAGGCWERLVQCVKRVLEVTICDQAPQFHTFQSALIEAENIVNSRPLTDLAIATEDDDPLTPNHFLLGGPSFTQTPKCGPVNLEKQWHVQQGMMMRFWKLWIQLYAPTLTRREKWCQPTMPLKVGSIVVIVDRGLGKGVWLKGRVVEVITAPDGHTRSAVVRTRNGDLHRPISKLAVLDLKPPGGQDVI